MKIRVFFLLLILGLTACKQSTPAEEQQEPTDVSQSIEEVETLEETTIQDEVSEVIEQGQNPKELLIQLQNSKADFDFYASFTEPFWSLYFVGDRVIFDSSDEDPDFYSIDQRFNPNSSRQTIRLSNEDKTWEVVIEKGEGSDGMSDIIYPYNVIMDSTFYGGGGTEFVHEDY
jgi:uncharacterized membrane protein